MRPEVQVLPGPPCAGASGAVQLQEVLRVLKKLALVAVVAGAVAAVRKRSSGRAETDLWHEATRGPGAVSTPTAP